MRPYGTAIVVYSRTSETRESCSVEVRMFSSRHLIVICGHPSRMRIRRSGIRAAAGPRAPHAQSSLLSSTNDQQCNISPHLRPHPRTREHCTLTQVKRENRGNVLRLKYFIPPCSPVARTLLRLSFVSRVTVAGRWPNAVIETFNTAWAQSSQLPSRRSSSKITCPFPDAPSRAFEPSACSNQRPKARRGLGEACMAWGPARPKRLIGRGRSKPGAA